LRQSKGEGLEEVESVRLVLIIEEEQMIGRGSVWRKIPCLSPKGETLAHVGHTFILLKVATELTVKDGGLGY